MITLLQSSVDTDVSLPVALSHRGGDDLRVQVDFAVGATGTVRVYGRISSDLKWVLLNTVTTDTLLLVEYVEYVRATLTGSAGGVVTVGVAV